MVGISFFFIPIVLCYKKGGFNRDKSNVAGIKSTMHYVP
jgi:hypothetical protein